MAKQQILDILTDEFLNALMDRGVIPVGTTRASVWAGNQNGASHIKIIINNDTFEDLTPIPVSDTNIPTAIENLGL